MSNYYYLIKNILSKNRLKFKKVILINKKINNNFLLNQKNKIKERP